jgi:hypothetical protein
MDPSAFWDDSTNTGQGSCAGTSTPCGPISPRVVPIAVFDPALFEQTRSTPGGPQLRVTNVLGVFIDGVVKVSVTGYVVPLPGLIEPGQ